MSSVYDKLKKTSGSNAGDRDAGAEKERSGAMDVNEMKRQILEKLKEKKASGVPTQSPSDSGEGVAAGTKDPVKKLRDAADSEPGPKRELAASAVDTRKEIDEYKAKLERAEAEKTRIAAREAEAVRQREALSKEVESKRAEVAELQQKVAGGIRFADAMNATTKQAGDADRLAKELEEAKRQLEDHRARYEAAQTDSKRIATLQAEAAKQRDALMREIEAKGGLIEDLQKKLTDGIEELKKERDRVRSLAETAQASVAKAGDNERLVRELGNARRELADVRGALEAARAQAKQAVAVREDAVKQREALAREIDVKSGLAEEFQKKLSVGIEELKKERERSRSLSDTAKASGAKAKEAEGLAQELDNARRELAEMRVALEAVQAQAKQAGVAREDAAKQAEKLYQELEEKTAQTGDLQKAADDESAKAREEKARADSLEELVKAKEKKMASFDRLIKELDETKRAADGYRVQLDAVGSEHRKASSSRLDALKHCKRMRADLQKKSDLISELERQTARWNDEIRKEKDRQKAEAEAFKTKLYQATKDHADQVESLEEAIGASQKRVAEAEKVYKELEAARREAAGYRSEAEDARAEIDKLSRFHEDVKDRHVKLQEELESKHTALQGLEKQYQDELEEMKREKDKATANVESLRSKLYIATKEAREQASKIAQMEDILKVRDRKASEAEKLYAELGLAKGELESKLGESREEVGGLEDKIAGMSGDFASKEAELAETEKAYKALEAASAETALELQTKDRDIKKLEAQVAQLSLEIDAKNTRLEETEKLRKETENLVNDVTAQYQESQRGRKDLEGKIVQLEAQIETFNQDMAENGRAYNKLEAAKVDFESKLRASREEAGEFEARIADLQRELGMKDEKISGIDAAQKEAETAGASLASQLESARRDSKDLGMKISQLKLETEAKDARLKEGDRLQAEMEGIVKDLTFKLQAEDRAKKELESRIGSLEHQSNTHLDMAKETEIAAKGEVERLGAEIESLKGAIKEKERREAELRNSVAAFESEIQARDMKIESDMKYTEKVVKEVSELRKKLGSAERQS